MPQRTSQVQPFGNLRCRSGLGTTGPVDQLQVAQIHQETAELAHEEHRVVPVNRIEQKQERAAEAEIPELDRHYALAHPLATPPLHQEAHGEEGLADEAEREPELVMCHGNSPR